MASLNFSSTAVEMTLQADVNSSATTFSVDTVAGLPATPFMVTVDIGQGAEEVVKVGGVSGTNLTSLTRGQDGTTAVAHLTGAKIRHTLTAGFLQDLAEHLDATEGVHGVPGAPVDTTSAQTLDLKTFTSQDSTGAPLTVRQASGQTDAILSVKNSSNTQTASVTGDGTVDAAAVTSRSGVFTAGSAGSTPLTAKGAASQTANVFSVKDSGDTTRMGVAASGRISTPGLDGTDSSVFAAGSTSTVPLKAQGAAGQSARIFQVLNSAGSQLAAFTSAGRLEGPGADLGTVILISPSNSANPLVVRGAASQTGDLEQWQNSGGSVLARMGPDGTLYVTNLSETTGAAYGSWTPSFGSDGGGSPALGSATYEARWRRIGRTIHAMGGITLAANSNMGQGNVTIALPITARSSSNITTIGTCTVGNGSGTRRTGNAELFDTTRFRICLQNGDFVAGPGSIPFAWGSGAFIRFDLTYET